MSSEKMNGKHKAKNGEASFLSSKDTVGAVISFSDNFRNELGQFTNGNAGTQKRYDNKEDLQAAILLYFEFCDTNKKHLTMTGLAIALGFRSRQALINYEKEPGYEFAFDVILYAKMKIEEYTEQKLHDRQANIIGAIFSLKNNWGWADKSEVKLDQTTKQFLGFEIDLTDEPTTIDIKEN